MCGFAGGGEVNTMKASVDEPPPLLQVLRLLALKLPYQRGEGGILELITTRHMVWRLGTGINRFGVLVVSRMLRGVSLRWRHLCTYQIHPIHTCREPDR